MAKKNSEELSNKQLEEEDKKQEQAKKKYWENPIIENHPWRLYHPKYKIGDWLELERAYEKDYKPEGSYDEWQHFTYMGYYEKLFEQSEFILGRKPTLYDYHNLYVRILERINEFTILDNLYLLTCWEKLSIDYDDIETAYTNEKKKLDDVFKEFAAKVESPGNEPENVKKKSKQELSDLQKHLIHVKKLLFPDGKRVIKNLFKVAEEVVKFTGQPITSQFIYENFRKSSGVKYRQSFCDSARNFANTQ